MDVLDIYGLPVSKWRTRGRRQLAIVAYQTGASHLRKHWPKNDPELTDERLAIVLGKLAAALGH